MTRRIFFITGARSDYDLMSPVLRSLENSKDIEASLVVGAAHLSPFHGSNINVLQKDGFKISGTIESLVASETWEGRSLSFANLYQGLTHLLSRDKPDMIYVTGDREEALAGALVGCFLRIPVAHSHGGDRCIASDIDEVFRPAISKLANLHFVATQDHADRLIKMGEEAESVFVTGAAGLDRLDTKDCNDIKEIYKNHGVESAEKHFLVIHHPSPTLGLERGLNEIRNILKATLSLGHPVFCGYPNFDPGNVAIRNEIDKFKRDYSNLVTHHNLPNDEFISLYKNASAIVGNSSSIVIESAYLKVPGVLVGDRQKYRTTGNNVLQVDSEAEIIEACKKALNDNEFLELVRKGVSIYGDGHTSKKIASILESLSFESINLLKTITY